MTATTTLGSSDISDTGMVPRGFPLDGAAGLNGSAFAGTYKGPKQMNDENRQANGGGKADGNGTAQERQEEEPKAGIGHNRDKAPSWATPSKLSLDEAAQANIGTGRYAHERRALIEAIFDPRLGIAPLPLQLLAAVVECINGKTGTAHPGGKYWARRIVNYLNGLPAQYREGALKNAVTAVRQAGYAVSERRAAEKGGRAIAHFAITCPTPEEKQAGIEAYLQEKQGLPPSEVTRRMTSACGHSGGDLSCGHPADDHRPGCGHPGTEAEVTLGVKKRGPHSITEPGSLFNPHRGADAPRSVEGEEGFSGGASDQGVAPPERAQPSARGAPCKPSPEVDDEVKLSPVAQEALVAFNAAAAEHGFTPCRTPTDTQAKRLEKRLKGIGGLRRFKRALGALPADDFLMGRVKPRDGGKPFRLNLDRLLRTDGPMGDVLGRLLGLADEAGSVAPLDPEAALRHLAASDVGKVWLAKLGPEKGMEKLRGLIANSTKGNS